MFEKWIAKSVVMEGLSNLLVRVNRPIWNRVGPKWYSSTWWPGESLAAVQYTLLSLLAIAHAERLEIQPLVAALASEHRGSYRRRLSLLAKRMDGNASLLAALEKTPDALSDNTVLAIRFGSQSGTLAKTYEQLVDTERPSNTQVAFGLRDARRYWVILAATILLLIQALMFFIAPTIKRMSDEFEIRMPLPLRLLYATFELVWAYMPLVLLACVVVGWLVWSSPPRRFFRRQVADRFLQSKSLSLSSQLFRMLAVSVEAGRPLPGSLSTLAKYHFDKKTRQRLLIARNEVEQGVPGWYSLVDAKIITPDEFQALDAAASNKVQAWTLRRMAAVKQFGVQTRADARVSFIQPLVIFVFAAVVLWVCYSFFSVLTNMIQHLAV